MDTNKFIMATATFYTSLMLTKEFEDDLSRACVEAKQLEKEVINLMADKSKLTKIQQAKIDFVRSWWDYKNFSEYYELEEKARLAEENLRNYNKTYPLIKDYYPS